MPYYADMLARCCSIRQIKHFEICFYWKTMVASVTVHFGPIHPVIDYFSLTACSFTMNRLICSPQLERRHVDIIHLMNRCTGQISL